MAKGRDRVKRETRKPKAKSKKPAVQPISLVAPIPSPEPEKIERRRRRRDEDDE